MTYALDVWAPVKIEDIASSIDTRAARTTEKPVAGSERPQQPSAVHDEDQPLLDRLAASDEAAFRELVQRHIDRAFGLAVRILGGKADAEDVVQDTFLKVWIHRGEWQHGRAKFSTWLYRVVTNRCIDLRRRPRADDVEAIPEPADARPDAVSTMHRHQVSTILDEAIKRLPEQQRVALILSYHEDMSNADIADVMETTVSAVESLLKRGRQQLRAILRQNEGDIRQSFTD